MKILSWRACAAVLLGLASCLAQAQEIRVGVVNTDRILKESTLAKAAQTRLEQEFSRREKEISDQGNTLKVAADKLEKDSPTLSESQRATRQKQLVDQDREFQRKRRELQEDFNARMNEERQTVLERANRVLRQVAETEKFDLVLQDAVYVNPRVDLTDKVIRALNAQPAPAAK